MSLLDLIYDVIDPNGREQRQLQTQADLRARAAYRHEDQPVPSKDQRHAWAQANKANKAAGCRTSPWAQGVTVEVRSEQGE